MLSPRYGSVNKVNDLFHAEAFMFLQGVQTESITDLEEVMSLLFCTPGLPVGQTSELCLGGIGGGGERSAAS